VAETIAPFPGPCKGNLPRDRWPRGPRLRAGRQSQGGGRWRPAAEHGDLHVSDGVSVLEIRPPREFLRAGSRTASSDTSAIESSGEPI